MKIHSTIPPLKRLSVIIFFAFSFVLLLSAETTGIIKGRVIDSKNQPIEFATAALVNQETNEIVKGEVCNNKGEFVISKVIPGEYMLSVSMLGYAKTITDKIIIGKEKNSIIEKDIILKESSQQLSDVVVTAKHPFIEQTVDKIIINPEASITSASENVYEILRKLPGITIDNNDNISLKGLQGVKVLIDDKPTYVSSAQLASLLKSMQGKNVDKIEIIENPSARYDAEGNSGIINIKTKHLKAPGFNGSVNTGVNIDSKIGWNGGMDLNMNYGKLNLYGNYSNYHWSGVNGMYASRRFTSDALDGAYQLIKSDETYNGSSNNYKCGADYFIAKNHVLSAMFSGSNGSNRNIDNNNTSFTDKYLNVDSTLITISESKNRWRNKTYNLNYKWDVDTTGQSLSFDIDYAGFNFYSHNAQNGNYYDNYGTDINHGISSVTTQGNDINIFTSRLDYVLPINKKTSLESGIKTSFVNNDSYIDMNGFLNQDDRFVYEEDILAAYINAKSQLNKTTLQLGLRLENTLSKGNSMLTNQVKDSSYLKLFPSFFVQQQLNENNSLNFKYSYRIGRPSYNDLNPFRWMIDPYTYNVGNPNLKPQFTHSSGLSHNYKGTLITSLGLNYTTGLFTPVILQDDASKTVYQTMENLNNSLDINISETFQVQPTKWWKLNGTLTGMYKTIQMYDDTDSPLSKKSFMANMSNNFTLPFKIDMEVNGRYLSEQLVSNIIALPSYSIDLGLQRKILNDQGVVKVAVSDIFNTSKAEAYVKYDNVDIHVENIRDTRRINITFNYRFGKDNFKTRSNRTTASSEEQGRSSK